VPVAVELDKTHKRRFYGINSLLTRDGVQGRINVRQMICGDIAHKLTDVEYVIS
jgi:hypothetical protein